MSGIVSLRKMTMAEYADWHENSVRAYAGDKRQSLGIGEAQALELSRGSFADLLPEGLATPDNYLFVAQRGGATLGWLWFAVKTERGVTSAFVYDLEIKPEYRRQGTASAVMGLLENEARVRGAAKIALHVFGHNAAARDLYAKVGYRITDYSMAKDLA